MLALMVSILAKVAGWISINMLINKEHVCFNGKWVYSTCTSRTLVIAFFKGVIHFGECFSRDFG